MTSSTPSGDTPSGDTPSGDTPSGGNEDAKDPYPEYGQEFIY